MQLSFYCTCNLHCTARATFILLHVQPSLYCTCNLHCTACATFIVLHVQLSLYCSAISLYCSAISLYCSAIFIVLHVQPSLYYSAVFISISFIFIQCVCMCVLVCVSVCVCVCVWPCCSGSWAWSGVPTSCQSVLWCQPTGPPTWRRAHPGRRRGRNISYKAVVPFWPWRHLWHRVVYPCVWGRTQGVCCPHTCSAYMGTWWNMMYSRHVCCCYVQIQWE